MTKSRNIDLLVPLIKESMPPELVLITFSYLFSDLQTLPIDPLIQRYQETIKVKSERDPEIKLFLDLIGSQNIEILKEFFPAEFKQPAQKQQKLAKNISWEDFLFHSKNLQAITISTIQSLFSVLALSTNISDKKQINASLEKLVKTFCDDPQNKPMKDKLILDYFNEINFGKNYDSQRNIDAIKKIVIFSKYGNLPDISSFIDKQRTMRDSTSHALLYKIINLDRVKKLKELFPQLANDFKDSDDLVNHLKAPILLCMNFFFKAQLPLDEKKCQDAGLPAILPKYIFFLGQICCEKNWMNPDWMTSNDSIATEHIILLIKLGFSLPPLPPILQNENTKILEAILERNDGKKLLNESKDVGDFVLKQIKKGNASSVELVLNSCEKLPDMDPEAVYEAILSTQNLPMMLLLESFKVKFSLHNQYYFKFNDFFHYAIKINNHNYLQFLVNTIPMTDIDLLLLAYRRLNTNNMDLFLCLHKSFYNSLTESKDESKTIPNNSIFSLFNEAYEMQDKLYMSILINDFSNRLLTPTNFLRAIQRKNQTIIDFFLEANEAKILNINKLHNNRLALCEAVNFNINLAADLIRKHGAECSIAIRWMFENNQIGLFNLCLQLPEFQNEFIKIKDSLNFSGKEYFLLVPLIHGLDKKNSTLASTLVKYQELFEKIKSDFSNPTEIIIQFLLNTSPSGYLNFFSPSQSLLRKIEANPNDVDKILHDEIRHTISRPNAQDYLLKLLFLQKTYRTFTKASIKILNITHTTKVA